MEKFKIEEKIVAMLKTVYDPEIPVNVYDLGLIYKIDVSDNGEVALDMTLTAPNCPAADFIMEDIRQKVESVEGVTSATINLVFEPEWDKDMKGYTRFLGKLSELTDMGVEVHFFTGNHDIWCGDYLSKECGVIIHREALTTEIYGKEFYLAHGDGLGDPDKKFKLLRWMFHSTTLQTLFSAIHPRWSVELGLTWAKHSREKRVDGKEPDYMGENKEHLVLYTKEYLKSHPNINFFIYGHRHIELDLMLSATSRVLILGDWINYFSYAVFDGENLFLEEYIEGETQV